MSNLIEYLILFFNFVFSQLTNVANFFTSNTLGIIILGVVLLYVIVDVFLAFLHKGK